MQPSGRAPARLHHGEDLGPSSATVITGALLPADQQTSDDAAPARRPGPCHRPGRHRGLVAARGPAGGQGRPPARAASSSRPGAWRSWRLNTELLASELVANVVRHAKGPLRLRLLRSRTLICEVFDGSLTTPRIRRASWTDEGGRGLQLVAALCDRWGTRYLTTGKCIWTEQSLP